MEIDGIVKRPRLFRMRASSYYERIVDVMDELVCCTVRMRPHAAQLGDRHSECNEAGVPMMPLRTIPV